MVTLRPAHVPTEFIHPGLIRLLPKRLVDFSGKGRRSHSHLPIVYPSPGCITAQTIPRFDEKHPLAPPGRRQGRSKTSTASTDYTDIIKGYHTKDSELGWGLWHYFIYSA